MRDSPGPASDAAGAATAPAAAMPEHAAEPRGPGAAPAAPLLELGPFELLREGSLLLRGGGLTLRPGERVLLTGPSGSGKSSLLLALAGLAEEHAPGLELRGRLTRRAAPGALFQNPYAQLAAPDLEAEIALGLECAAWPGPAMRDRVAELVPAFRLEGLRGRAPWTFSGGEAQRLALAAALAPRPGVLLLDEPLGFLDAPSAAALVGLAKAWPRDAAWLVVDHDPAAWASWAERHLSVDAEGRLVEAPLPAPPGPPPAPAPLPEPALLAPPLLEIEGLRAGYGRGPEVLSGFDLRLAPGESLALVGPSGSGKSTLFACLCGRLRPRAGSIRLRGRDLGRGARGPAPFAWLPQVPEHYFVYGSAREEWAGAEEAARAFGLQPLAERHPFTLSEGEKRRLNLASALGLGREILLLDEPQFGLDAASRAALDAALAELRARGQAMIVISHDPDFCRANAHRVQEMPA